MKWISVEERLPEECVSVLVWIQDAAASWGEQVMFRRGEFVRYSYGEVNNVTHWMPLPEPPEQVECVCMDQKDCDECEERRKP